MAFRGVGTLSPSWFSERFDGICRRGRAGRRAVSRAIMSCGQSRGAAFAALAIGESSCAEGATPRSAVHAIDFGIALVFFISNGLFEISGDWVALLVARVEECLIDGQKFLFSNIARSWCWNLQLNRRYIQGDMSGMDAVIVSMIVQLRSWSAIPGVNPLFGQGTGRRHFQQRCGLDGG